MIVVMTMSACSKYCPQLYVIIDSDSDTDSDNHTLWNLTRTYILSILIVILIHLH